MSLVADEAIAEVAHDRLRRLLGDSARFHVAVERGIVMLTGTVPSDATARASVEVLQRISGVRAVVNRLKVPPIRTTDAEIQRQVDALFALERAVEGADLRVQVADGIVRLAGFVESVTEKAVVSELVKTVPGVEGLTDDVRVNVPEERSDSEIRWDILTSLRRNPNVDAFRLQVIVSEGSVLLAGTVESAAQKTTALADSWVAGVVEVKDGIEIDPALEKADFTSGLPPVTDYQLAEAIRAAWRLDPAVPEDALRVHVERGIAVVSGEAPDHDSMLAAARDAADTVGVRRVSNHIRVAP